MSEPKKTGLDLLREPFPAHQISKLPKPLKKREEMDKLPKAKCTVCEGFHATSNIIHLDYVGHAALTNRLLDADPQWTWEPLSMTADGLPRFDDSGGLWIKLTVCNVTRLGYGHAAPKGFGDPGMREKEVIGDAMRNAAMRFGAALDLWSKGQLHDDEPEPETKPAKQFPSPVTSALDGETFTDDQIKALNIIANSLVDLCTLASEGEDVDYKIWELMEPIDSSERLYLWQLLQPQSKVRARIKAVVMDQAKKDAMARNAEHA